MGFSLDLSGDVGATLVLCPCVGFAD